MHYSPLICTTVLSSSLIFCSPHLSFPSPSSLPLDSPSFLPQPYLTGARPLPTSDSAMKMDVPLPCLYPSPFLNKSTHNSSVNSANTSHTAPHNTSSSSLHTASSSNLRPQPISTTLPDATFNSSYPSMPVSVNSASIPMTLSPTHTTHTPHEHRTDRNVQDSSVMASSMAVVRSWKDRRCIHVDYVLGCRVNSDAAEMVSTYVRATIEKTTTK